MASVVVAVRVRPFNKREIARKAKMIIQMDGPVTQIAQPDTGKKNTFTFDYSHWTYDDSQEFADQEKVYNDLGKSMMEHAFTGYNICIFAYGQTGSGKSYSMMGVHGGPPEQQGIIPRACTDLFERVRTTKDENMSFAVEVSYLEIYNEKVRDLLNPKSEGNLRVREHPVLGPYVEGLSKMLVNDKDEIERLMDEGNKSRTVASTNMNSESSRSHAVFSIIFTQTETLAGSGLSSDKVSKISLVDLAGSERADSTGATGARLKEGANINKSLTCLGKVIAALAKASADDAKSDTPSKKKKGKKSSDNYIPYRDSALTWLLRENLGGNSRTAMVATLSPADINYDETLSTLRYADRAKQIVCKAIVNEDPNAKLIRELRGEIARLQAMIAGGGVAPAAAAAPNAGAAKSPDGGATAEDDETAAARLAETERLMAELQESKAEKAARTKQMMEEREAEMQKLGIAQRADGGHLGVGTGSQPHLVNLNEDPLMSELLLYYLTDNATTRLGFDTESTTADIKLSGGTIKANHCEFAPGEGDDAKIVITPLDGDCFVNGKKIDEKTELSTGDRLIFGENHVFRFVNPPEAKRLRERGISDGDTMDWASAQRELIKQQALADIGVDKEKEAETQARLADLEKQIAAEKEAADRLLEQQRAEFEERMRKIKAQNDSGVDGDEHIFEPFEATDNERRCAMKAYRKWRLYRHKSLETQLLANTPVLKEANAICTELNKNIVFQFVCRTGSHFFPSDPPTTQLMVELSNRQSHDRIALWPLSKLQERIFEMREFYQSAMTNKKVADPFSDRPPWFRSIGRAFMSLQSILYEVPVEHELLVMDEQCKVVGRIRVSIMPGQLISNLDEGEASPPGISDESHVDFSDYDGESNDERVNFHGDNRKENDAATERLMERAGSEYRFVITVLDASGVSQDFVDVFCQFKFIHQTDVAFSTESLQNSTGDLPFYHAQQFHVTVTGNFLEYCRNEPITFELFGHFDSHPLHDELEPDTPSPTSPLAKQRLSEPARTLSISGDEPTHDVLAWYEMCELAPSGEYAPVDVGDEKGTRVFLLQQGVQRKVRVTIAHESGDDLEWTRVMEMSIGAVRTTFEEPPSGGTPAIQLAVSPSQTTTTSSGDDRVFLAFEAAWDSAKHESIQLNRVTPNSEQVYCTLTFIVGVEGCSRPAVIRQTLAMRIMARDGGKRRSFFGSLLGPTIKDTSKISTFYEMRMHEVSDDVTVAAYDVEKRLRGWRPRSKSLLREHKKRIRKFNKVVEVESTRQLLELEKAKSASFQKEPVKVNVDGDAIKRKCVELMAAPDLMDVMLDESGRASPEAKAEQQEKKKKDMYPELTMIDPLQGVGYRGYLLFLETRNSGWVKRWAWVTRNFLFITDHEKDPVIRMAVRLSDITIQFNEDQGTMMGIRNLFTMCTKHRGFLVQTMKPKDMEDWLQNFDPLLAGTILSRMGIQSKRRGVGH